ncbi:hypothetical protein [Deinococcus kurensis]|uniref:hypothetical protein n=1 Tax=Deinococcus kurensis TaxID=2662757 RepID=UPI0012D32A9B|nr:hypothetical protein [Deinococcus kurensis]
MKKLNLYVTETNGTLTILTNVTQGQYRAIQAALGEIFPGAIISAVPVDVKPQRFNVNKVLASKGYDRFGDFVGIKEGDEALTPDEDGDDAEVEAAAGATDPSVLDFKPSFGRALQ